MKRLAVVLLVLFVACGTDARVTTLGKKLGCGSVRETGKVAMSGTVGSPAICSHLRSLAGESDDAAFVISFKSTATRDSFFTKDWPKSKFCGSLVVIGPTWALTFDPGSHAIDREYKVIRATGGADMVSSKIGFPGC